MSVVMTEDSSGRNDDREALAAEFVLGTADREERARAHTLLEIDADFRTCVRLWERRLSELHLMVEPVEPDAQILERIKTVIALERPAAPAPAPVEPEVAAGPDAPEAPVVADVQDESDAAIAASAAVEPGSEVSVADLSGVPVDVVIAPNAASLADQAHLVEVELAKLRAPDRVARKVWDAPDAVAEAMPRVVLTPAMPFEEAAPERARSDEQALDRSGEIRRWQLWSLAATVVAVLLAGLIAAWRFVPDELPLPLRPSTVLQIAPPSGVGAPLARRPAPPGSQFQE
jgi:anti-sigma-K factor RskA